MSIVRHAPITPLDPDSAKGREVAADLTRILAGIKIEMATQAALAATEPAPEPLTTPAIPHPRRPLPVETDAAEVAA